MPALSGKSGLNMLVRRINVSKGKVLHFKWLTLTMFYNLQVNKVILR